MDDDLYVYYTCSPQALGYDAPRRPAEISAYRSAFGDEDFTHGIACARVSKKRLLALIQEGFRPDADDVEDEAAWTHTDALAQGDDLLGLVRVWVAQGWTSNPDQEAAWEAAQAELVQAQACLDAIDTLIALLVAGDYDDALAFWLANSPTLAACLEGEVDTGDLTRTLEALASALLPSMSDVLEILVVLTSLSVSTTAEVRTLEAVIDEVDAPIPLVTRYYEAWFPDGEPTELTFGMQVDPAPGVCGDVLSLYYRAQHSDEEHSAVDQRGYGIWRASALPASMQILDSRSGTTSTTREGTDFVVRPAVDTPAIVIAGWAGLSPDQLLRVHVEDGKRVVYADPDPVELPDGRWRVFVSSQAEGGDDYPYTAVDGDPSDACVNWEDMFPEATLSHRESLEAGMPALVTPFPVTIQRDSRSSVSGGDHASVSLRRKV